MPHLRVGRLVDEREPCGLVGGDQVVIDPVTQWRRDVTASRMVGTEVRGPVPVAVDSDKVSVAMVPGVVGSHTPCRAAVHDPGQTREHGVPHLVEVVDVIDLVVANDRVPGEIRTEHGVDDAFCLRGVVEVAGEYEELRRRHARCGASDPVRDLFQVRRKARQMRLGSGVADYHKGEPLDDLDDGVVHSSGGVGVVLESRPDRSREVLRIRNLGGGQEIGIRNAPASHHGARVPAAVQLGQRGHQAGRGRRQLGDLDAEPVPAVWHDSGQIGHARAATVCTRPVPIALDVLAAATRIELYAEDVVRVHAGVGDHPAQAVVVEEVPASACLEVHLEVHADEVWIVPVERMGRPGEDAARRREAVRAIDSDPGRHDRAAAGVEPVGVRADG